MSQPHILYVGTGAIARLHEEGRKNHPEGGSWKVSAFDPNPEALKSFGSSDSGIRCCNSVEELLSPPPEEQDVVVVCTPPVFHKELVLQALESGRHVLCEKPLGMNREEAQRMEAAARNVDRELGCCSNRFFAFTGFTEFRHTLDPEDLYHVTWRMRQPRARSGLEYQPETDWFLSRKINGGGVMQDWCPYDISMLCHILQPIRVEVLHAWNSAPHTWLPPEKRGKVDVEFHGAAEMMFHLENGKTIPVSLERASCLHGRESSEFLLEGIHRSFSIDWISEEPSVTCFEDRDGQLFSSEIIKGKTTWGDIHATPLRSFVAHVSGKENDQVVTGARVRLEAEILDALYRCASEKTSITVLL